MKQKKKLPKLTEEQVLAFYKAGSTARYIKAYGLASHRAKIKAGKLSDAFTHYGDAEAAGTLAILRAFWRWYTSN